MNLHIHLRGPGLDMLTRLKPEALDPLLKLLHEHRDTTAEMPMRQRPEGGPRRHQGPVPVEGAPQGKGADPSPERLAVMRERKKAEKIPEVAAAIEKLRAMEAPPLSTYPGLTFPEKVLLLCGWTEAKGEKFILRGPAVVRAFVAASESPPANPKRDIMAAVSDGLLAVGIFPNPQRAVLTAAGIQRVADMLA